MFVGKNKKMIVDIIVVTNSTLPSLWVESATGVGVGFLDGFEVGKEEGLRVGGGVDVVSGTPDDTQRLYWPGNSAEQHSSLLS